MMFTNQLNNKQTAKNLKVWIRTFQIRSFSIALVISLGLLLLTVCAPKDRDEIDGDDIAGDLKLSRGELVRDREPIDLKTLQTPYYTEISWDEDEPLEISGPFELLDFGPKNTIPDDLEYPEIYLLFSQPVIPLEKLGETDTISPVVTIDPELAGAYRWHGTRLLSFIPASPVLPQQEYQVQIQKNLMSLGGVPYTGKEQFTFTTAPLSIKNLILGPYDRDDVPVDKAQTIGIEFSYPVDPQVVGEYLAVYPAERAGQRMNFSVSRPQDPELSPEKVKRMVLLTLNEPPPPDTKVNLVLLKGARSEAGFIGNQEERHFTFHTIKPFKFREYSSSSNKFFEWENIFTPLYLQFSHPIDETFLKGAVWADLEGLADEYGHDVQTNEVHKPAALADGDYFVLNEKYFKVRENELRIANLPVEYGSSYSLIITSGLTDIYGRTLTEEIEVTVRVPEAPRYSRFPQWGPAMLEAQFPPLIVYETQNIFEGHWHIAAINDPYTSFTNDDLGPLDLSRAEKNRPHFEKVDLSPFLNRWGKGAVGLAWNLEPPGEDGSLSRWGLHPLQVQVTDLGLTTRYAYNRVIALVTTLSTGKAVEGARVALMREQEVMLEGTTDQQGMVLFNLEDGDYTIYFGDRNNPWLDHLRFRVDIGYDYIEFGPNRSHNVWAHHVYNVKPPVTISQPEMVTFLFTDRGLYNPGDTVQFRGIDQILTLGRYTPYVGPCTVRVKEERYQGKVLFEFEDITTPSGGVYGSFTLPADLRPGNYRIEYIRNGNDSGPGRAHNEVRSVRFQVAHFEPLGFSVAITPGQSEYLLKEELTAEVQVEYYGGGVPAGAEYNYNWIKEPVFKYQIGPADLEQGRWEGYRFGPLDYDRTYNLSAGEGALDSSGRTVFKQQSTSEGVTGLPYLYTGEIRVEDESGEMVAARASMTVHPAAFYIGLNLPRPFVSLGSTMEIDYATLPAESSRQALLSADTSNGIWYGPDDLGPLEVEIYQVSWKTVRRQGAYGHIHTHYEQVKELEASKQVPFGPGNFSITPEKAGLYLVRISGADKLDRTAVTEEYLYATGAQWVNWGFDYEAQIGLEKDKDIYTPGETANILLKSPLPEGKYLVTVEREGIFDEQIINIKGSSQVIGIPIQEEYLPVVYVTVSSYSTRTREPDHTFHTPDLDKPKGYFGILPLHVDTGTRELDITIETDKAVYKPGETVRASILVTYDDRPVRGAEVTFLAVDRAVTDRIAYKVPDPVEFFYAPGHFPLGVAGADSRSLLLDPVTYDVRSLHGGGGGGKADGLREDFTPTAVFEPFLTTNAQGKANISFTLPDSLTIYRTTALAVDGDTFGISHAELPARNPISARALVPSVVRYRDTFNGGLLLTNLTNTSQEVTVTTETELLCLADYMEDERPPQKTIILQPNETQYLSFSMLPAAIGKGRIVFTLVSEVLQEQLAAEIDIELPRVQEAVTTVGRMTAPDSKAHEQIVLPALPPLIPRQEGDAGQHGERREDRNQNDRNQNDVNQNSDRHKNESSEKLDKLGKIESFSSGDMFLSIGGTGAGIVRPAVAFLEQYPHALTEVLAAKTLPKLYLDPAEAARQIKSLAELQLEEGGFPFWPERITRAAFYPSLRTALLWGWYYQLAEHQQDRALQDLMGSNPFDTGASIFHALDRTALLEYLTDIAFRSGPGPLGPVGTPGRTYTQAFVLYVRALLGDRVGTEARRMLQQHVPNLATYALLGLTFEQLAQYQAEGLFENEDENEDENEAENEGTDLPEQDQALTDYSRKALEIMEVIESYLIPGARSVDIGGTWTRGAVYGSRTEETALIMLLLRKLKPHHELLPRLSAALELQAGQGHWGSVSETSWAVLALLDRQEAAGTFSYTAALDQTILAEGYYSGDAPAHYRFSLDQAPLKYLERDTQLAFDLQKEGEGTLFYTLMLRYRLPAESLSPRDQGVSILAEIETLAGKPVDPQNMRAGEMYRKRVFVSSPRNLEHLMLQVPVPSGAEVLDGGFVTTPRVLTSQSEQPQTYTWRWIEKNRVDYLFDTFKTGRGEVSFIFRAAYTGVYPTPPATAESLYQPEIFGRSSGYLSIIQ